MTSGMAGNLNQGQRREPGWISRDDRVPAGLCGSAQRADGSQISVTVSDLSRDGCRLDFNGDGLRIGEWVDLQADGQQKMRGQVRWALLGSAGLRFGDS
jgi:hypothetical protein